MIYKNIKDLINYGIEKELITEKDEIYIRNELLEVLKLDTFIESENYEYNPNLENILSAFSAYALDKDLIENTRFHIDNFQTRIMGLVTPKPHLTEKIFYEKYKISSKEATNWYYEFSQNTNYIKRHDLDKDLKWQTESPYGKMDITINLSKPEKDPKDIARAKNEALPSYPKCLLCKENVGYNGNAAFPARNNHRIIPVKLNGEKWHLQYSPYVYYNEHCIVLSDEHIPMKIEKSTFIRLMEFTEMFAHYFIGSNADLPIVGGSILNHEHYQGGNNIFPVDIADDLFSFDFANYKNIKASVLNWPVSVIKLESKNKCELIDCANNIYEKWRCYKDEDLNIFDKTDGIIHNTITPVARKNENIYTLYIALRNNKTNEQYPYGIFHPHEEIHNIKKDNIGLIEVMGLAILPSRLKAEMCRIKQLLINKKPLKDDPLTAKHEHWVNSFSEKYTDINAENIDKIIEDEIGNAFIKVLEDCGVFKLNDAGITGFKRFLNYCNM